MLTTCRYVLFPRQKNTFGPTLLSRIGDDTIGGVYIQRLYELSNIQGIKEDSFYPMFESFFQRRAIGTGLSIIAQNRQGEVYPDFSIYRDPEGGGVRELICFIEAKRPGVNIDTFIAQSQVIVDGQPAIHQINNYLRMSQNLIITDFQRFAVFQNGNLLEQTFNLFDEFAPSSQPNDEQINSLLQTFDSLIELILGFDVSVDITPAGAIRQLASLSVATQNAYLVGANSPPGTSEHTISKMYKAVIDQLVPETNEEARAALVGQLMGTTMLIFHRQQVTDLDVENLDDEFLHADLLRMIFRLTLHFRDFLGFDAIFEQTIDVLNQVGEDFELNTPRDLENAFLNLASYIDPGWHRKFGFAPTPDEVIGFMIQNVDHSIRQREGFESRGIATLSDENQPLLNILDPATGTGRYVVMLLDRIWENLSDVNIDIRREYMRSFIGTEERYGNLLAFDIQPMCVLWSTIMVHEWCLENDIDSLGIRPNIRLVDAIGPTGLKNNFTRFYANTNPPDVIIGNPPWGAHEQSAQQPGHLDEWIGTSTEEGHLRDYLQRARSLRGTSDHRGPKKEVAVAFTICLKRALNGQTGMMSLILPDSIARKETWCSVRENEFTPSRITIDYLDGGSDGDAENVFGQHTQQPNIILLIDQNYQQNGTVRLREDWSGLTSEQKITRLAGALPTPLNQHEEQVSEWFEGYTEVAPLISDWSRWRIPPELHIDWTAIESSPSLWEVSHHEIWTYMADESGGGPIDVHRTHLVARMRSLLGDNNEYTWEQAQGAQRDYTNRLRFTKSAANAIRVWEAARPFSDELIERLCYYPMVQIFGYVHPRLWGKAGSSKESQRSRSGPHGYLIVPGQSRNLTLPDIGSLVAFLDYYPAQPHVGYQNGKPFAWTIHPPCATCEGNGELMPEDFLGDQPVQCADCEGSGLTDGIMANISQPVSDWLSVKFGESFTVLNQLERANLVWGHVLAILSSANYAPIIQWSNQDVVVPFPSQFESLRESSTLGRSLASLQSLGAFEEDSEWGGLYAALDTIMLNENAVRLRLVDSEGNAQGVDQYSITGYSSEGRWNRRHPDEEGIADPDLEDLHSAIEGHIENLDEGDPVIGHLQAIRDVGFVNLSLHRGSNDLYLAMVPMNSLKVRLGNHTHGVISSWLCLHSRERTSQCDLSHLQELREIIIRLTVISRMFDRLDENLNACVEGVLKWEISEEE